jgi:hypothetical protein
MSRTSHASALAFAAMVLGAAIESPAATNSFYDFENFENNAIDRSVWSVTGDGIGVSGGAVTIARNDPVDAMTSVDRFEGQFIGGSIELWNCGVSGPSPDDYRRAFARRH